MQHTIITLTAALGIFTASFGQPESADSLWTLEECISHAIDYNLQVKRQERLHVNHFHINTTQAVNKGFTG